MRQLCTCPYATEKRRCVGEGTEERNESAVCVREYVRRVLFDYADNACFASTAIDRILRIRLPCNTIDVGQFDGVCGD